MERPTPSEIPTDTQPKELLLDRLKRMQSDSSTPGPTEEIPPEVLRVPDPTFEHEARILASNAKTQAYKDHRPELIPTINASKMVPDDVVPDIHRNEITRARFIETYLS